REGLKQDRPLEAAGREPRPAPGDPAGEPQLLPRAHRSGLRLRVAQVVGDRSTDRQHVEIGHGVGGHAHLDRPALTLDLHHTAPPLVRSSVPSTPTTSIPAPVVVTHTVTARGTCTSSSADPATSMVRTCASPVAEKRPAPRSRRAVTARVSASQPRTWIFPNG